MKLAVFFNANGISEPEGWYLIGMIPIKSETEGREKAEKMKDDKTIFKIITED